MSSCKPLVLICKWHSIYVMQMGTLLVTEIHKYTYWCFTIIDVNKNSDLFNQGQLCCSTSGQQIHLFFPLLFFARVPDVCFLSPQYCRKQLMCCRISGQQIHLFFLVGLALCAMFSFQSGCQCILFPLQYCRKLNLETCIIRCNQTRKVFCIQNQWLIIFGPPETNLR